MKMSRKGGVAFKVFDTLAKKNINVDVILQSIGRAGTKDISFTVNKDDVSTVEAHKCVCMLVVKSALD